VDGGREEGEREGGRDDQVLVMECDGRRFLGLFKCPRFGASKDPSSK